MPRPDSVARVSPRRNRACRGRRGCRARGRASPAETAATIERGRLPMRPRSVPSGCSSPPAPPHARARRPAAEDREEGGQQGQGGGEHLAIPIARIGPSQRVDSRSASSRTSIAPITVPAEARSAARSRPAPPAAPPPAHGRGELLPVAVDQQQGVVGAGAEDQHQEQDRALGIDVISPARSAGRRRRSRSGRRRRRRTRAAGPAPGRGRRGAGGGGEAERRDQQGLGGVFGDPLEVGGDPARAGHVRAQPRLAVVGEVGADPADAVDDRAAIAGVDRPAPTIAASPSRETGPTPRAILATSPSDSLWPGRRRGRRRGSPRRGRDRSSPSPSQTDRVQISSRSRPPRRSNTTRTGTSSPPLKSR